MVNESPVTIENGCLGLTEGFDDHTQQPLFFIPLKLAELSPQLNQTHPDQFLRAQILYITVYFSIFKIT